MIIYTIYDAIYSGYRHTLVIEGSMLGDDFQDGLAGRLLIQDLLALQVSRGSDAIVPPRKTHPAGGTSAAP